MSSMTTYPTTTAPAGAPGAGSAKPHRSLEDKMRIGARAAVIALALLAFLPWIVGLAGMAAVSHDCHQFDSWGGCARSLQYEWWGLWFEFFLLIAILIVAFMDRLYVNQLTLLTFLAICTMVLMWSARSVMVGDDYIASIQGHVGAKNAVAAGYVMLCIFNFALIFVLGYVERIPTRAEAANNGQAYAKDGAMGKGNVHNVVAVPGRAAPAGTVIMPPV